MDWWVPFPLAFNADPRVRALSLGAAGVLAHLLVEAAGHGGDRVPLVNHHGAAGTVALVALGRPGAPEAVAAEYAELLACGCVEATATELRILVGARPAGSGAAQAPAPTRIRPPSADPARVAARKTAWKERQGRPAPATPSTQAPPEPAGEDRNGTGNDPHDPPRNEGGTTRNDPAERGRNDPGTTPPTYSEKSSDSEEIDRKTSEVGARAERPRNEARNDPAERPSGEFSANSNSSEELAEKPRRPKGRPRKPPPPDPVPLPGTAERRAYDAIVGDRLLVGITEGPGEYAGRLPGMFPHVPDLAAEIRRAGEYATRRGKRYSSGRAYLSNWLRTADDDAARGPRPPPPAAPQPPPGPRAAAPASAFARATAAGHAIGYDPLASRAGAGPRGAP